MRTRELGALRSFRPVDLLQELIAGGQPVVLVDPSGRPVAVVLDVESYEESEEAAEAAA